MTARLCDWAFIGAQSPDDCAVIARISSSARADTIVPLNVSLIPSFYGEKPNARRSRSAVRFLTTWIGKESRISLAQLGSEAALTTASHSKC